VNELRAADNDFLSCLSDVLISFLIAKIVPTFALGFFLRIVHSNKRSRWLSTVSTRIDNIDKYRQWCPKRAAGSAVLGYVLRCQSRAGLMCGLVLVCVQ
jgi:hypothetical protein